jgi:predicted transcriptional regulator
MAPVHRSNNRCGRSITSSPARRASGRTTREISAEIFVSEHTVQRHIQNAFEKVGVRNRGELLKRLFFENLLPGMLGG